MTLAVELYNEVDIVVIHLEQPSCGGQTTLWTTFATCCTGCGGGAGLVGRTLMVSGVMILASCVICSGECFGNVLSVTAYVEGRSAGTGLDCESIRGNTTKHMRD